MRHAWWPASPGGTRPRPCGPPPLPERGSCPARCVGCVEDALFDRAPCFGAATAANMGLMMTVSRVVPRRGTINTPGAAPPRRDAKRRVVPLRGTLTLSLFSPGLAHSCAETWGSVSLCIFDARLSRLHGGAGASTKRTKGCSVWTKGMSWQISWAHLHGILGKMRIFASGINTSEYRNIK